MERESPSAPRELLAGREIWVMDSRGNNPQKVLGLAADEFLWSVNWSPDGNRLGLRQGPSGVGS